VADGIIRVASVPAAHPYVQHLSPPGGPDGVVRLDDPPVPGAPRGQWWPPPMLESSWVAAHAGLFDLLHVHFGFESRTPGELGDLLAALRRAGRPLVVTVHDLRNPHLVDPGAHLAALDVLVGEADAVITLTAGVAEEIRRRWSRTAEVIAHPHLVDLDRIGCPRPAHDGFVVGQHAKSERVNNDSVAVARVLADVVGSLPGGRLRIRAHDDDRGAAVARAVADLASPWVEIIVHRRLSDEELWADVSALDVSVLPYRYGTHSGWLELCHDLGTTVLAPTCGYYQQQGPCLSFHHDEAGLDAASLDTAVRRAYQERPGWRWSAADRRAQRAEIAWAHRQLYLRVLGRSA
jgi:hypothetical protein